MGVGVGLGEVDGAGFGDSVGDEGDGDCACAADMAPTASGSAMARRRAHARPAPNLTIRETRDEQRIDFIPEKERPLEKHAKSLPAGLDLRPVHAHRQSVRVLSRG
jgi:hypothetical protein